MSEPKPDLSPGTYMFIAAVILALIFFSPEIVDWLGG